MKKLVLITLAVLSIQTSFATSANNYLRCKKGKQAFIGGPGVTPGGSVSGTDLTVDIYGLQEGGTWELVDRGFWHYLKEKDREAAFQKCNAEIVLWDINQNCANGDKDTFCALNSATKEKFSDDYDDLLKAVAKNIKTKIADYKH
jgi:hypothetical protein